MFQHLINKRSAKSLRSSSYDRTGGNRDYITVEPGATATLLDVVGQGMVTHTYCAMVMPDPSEYRYAIIRMYWDGADEPSVAVPLGDFFGVIQGRVRSYQSLVMSVNPGFGVSHGLNCYFPMPFRSGARITVENTGPTPLGGPLHALWFHIDYELYQNGQATTDDALRFHATFRQERPTLAIGPEPNEQLPGGVNLDGNENYVALDASGSGHMAGLVLEVDNIQGKRWYGEGDDMVFIDGDAWPPSLHGTGTEEIFGGGACPAGEYAGPYTGFHLVESADYDGITGMYRWYLHDPIRFDSRLRWTIEHGHANNFANDYASVAYWYQTPTAAADPVPDPAALAPRLDDTYAEAKALVAKTLRDAGLVNDYQGESHLLSLKAFQAGLSFSEGRWAQAITELEEFRRAHGLH